MADASPKIAQARPSTTLLEIQFGRQAVIAAIAFLTVVDLFATQAILPSLVAAYRVSPAAMGTAVNASTFGMAVAGLVIAYFSRRIDQRRGIVASLVVLSVPTALLAFDPDAVDGALDTAEDEQVEAGRRDEDVRREHLAAAQPDALRGEPGDGVRVDPELFAGLDACCAGGEPSSRA